MHWAHNYKSLVDVLFSKNSDTRGITFINMGRDKYVSYAELFNKALTILYELQKRGLKVGDELVFQLEDNEYFIYIFWACILGKIIPVPVTIGNNKEHRLKVFKIWEILKKPHLIIDQRNFAKLEQFAAKNLLDRTLQKMKNNLLLVHQVKNNQNQGIIKKSCPGDIAFIQFSSGSTGDPKGVMLTHENILVNTAAIKKATGYTSRDSTLSWAPLTHDMGIIGFHITPLIAGINQFIMPTKFYITYPGLWLEKADEYRVSILASPNFGYKYYLSFCGLEPVKHLDLSCVRLIANGAEPISMDLCNRFLVKLKSAGLKQNVMCPVYGLAEACLAVSASPPADGIKSVSIDRERCGIGDRVVYKSPAGENTITFIDVGYAIENMHIRIVDGQQNQLPPDTIGHIQIKGKNVTSRYYNNKKATQQAFNKDGWLDTGDIGFLRNNRLIVTGRVKDIISAHGQNYYSHDLERMAEEVEGIEAGKVAAVGTFNEKNQEEEVIIFIMFRKKNLKEFIPLAVNLKKYIHSQIGLRINHVIPVSRIPKSTSGKIQRFKLKDNYIKGILV